jgi:hypothetical protein
VQPAGSGEFVGAELVASDLNRRRINDKVQRRCSGLGHVRRQSQMPEDGRNHRGVFDEGGQGEASVTPGTGEHIQAQAPAHQLRPEIVACMATVRRVAGVIGGRVRVRCGVGVVRGPEVDLRAARGWILR